MKTFERLKMLKKWTYDTICAGREMKAPGANIGEIVRQEPQVHLVFEPARPDGKRQMELVSVTPGILILLNRANAKYEEEKRFDRYNGIHRLQSLGQQMAVSVLFCVYEPGTRERGFVDSYEKGKPDYSLVREATEKGLETLLNWMDEFKQNLINCKIIPESDLAVNDDSIVYDMFGDANYTTDKRPLYYGFVHATFDCYADDGCAKNRRQSGRELTVEELLDR